VHRRQLPLVFQCSRDLQQMPARAGGRERWCEGCKQTVHDLSQHSESEARALLRRSASPCIAYAFDAAGHVQFRRTRLDRVGVALTSLALLVSLGTGAYAWQLDTDMLRVTQLDPGCSGPFELPEPPPPSVRVFMGEMDDVDGEVLQPMSDVRRRHALGGLEQLGPELDAIRELVELTERQAPD
jgi:hypothetical protein